MFIFSRFKEIQFNPGNSFYKWQRHHKWQAICFRKRIALFPVWNSLPDANKGITVKRKSRRCYPSFDSKFRLRLEKSGIDKIRRSLAFDKENVILKSQIADWWHLVWCEVTDIALSRIHQHINRFDGQLKAWQINADDDNLVQQRQAQQNQIGLGLTQEKSQAIPKRRPAKQEIILHF